MKGGRSAPLTQFCTREDVFSGWADDLRGGRSAPGARTVRRLFEKNVLETFWSLLVFKVERRTVRPWGADGLPVIFKNGQR